MPLSMRLSIGLISIPTLAAYLLTSWLSGLGAIVLCQNVDGSVCVEGNVSVCCEAEHGSDIAVVEEKTDPGDCDDCTDLPLGTMPSRESMSAPSIAKATVAKATVVAALVHYPSISFVPVPVRDSATRQRSAGVPPDRLLALNTIVIRC
jgi:hypothetical protein